MSDVPKLMWVYDPSKEHCDDCGRLHGQVHWASEWRDRAQRALRILQDDMVLGANTLERIKEIIDEAEMDNRL